MPTGMSRRIDPLTGCDLMGIMPTRRILAATLVAAVALAASACTRTASTSPPAARSGHHVSGDAPPGSAPACGPAMITASLDTEYTGLISGRENVVFDLHNGSGNACDIGGYATLWTLAGGSSSQLTFPHDPAFFSRDVAGPGVIPPDGLARFTVTVAVTGCDKPVVTAGELTIEVPGIEPQTVPYPKELATAGCPLREGPIGPVTAS
jgi:hypothetical protein